jgi:hypothetical protein
VLNVLGTVLNVSELCEISRKCVKCRGIVQNLSKYLGSVQNASQVCLENCANTSEVYKMSLECVKCLHNVQNVSGVGEMSPWACAGSLFPINQFFRWIYLLSGGHHVVIYLFILRFRSRWVMSYHIFIL